MKTVGFFAGNVDNNLLNKKLFFDDMSEKFYIEGQNVPLAKEIIETLNKKNIITWTDLTEVAPALGSEKAVNVSSQVVDKNTFRLSNGIDFCNKDIYSINLEDYNFALVNPDNPWSEYLIGLYLLKSNDKIQAFLHLKNFYMKNPLETKTIKYLLLSQGHKIDAPKAIPVLLPEELKNVTISQKYINDFMAFNMDEIPIKITRLKVVNFTLTLLTVVLFLISFMTPLIWTIIVK